MTDQTHPILIDSHAHLDFDRFDEDRDAVIERALEAGVERIITIGTDVASSRRAIELAEAYPMIYASVGIHPHDADKFDDDDWGILETLWTHDRVKSVGETGLDYYYDYSDRPRQKVLFRRHLEAAAETGLPVVVHIRDAFDDAYELIEDVGVPSGGVVHCFTGGPRECERALSLGMHISLSGIVTFKNARDLHEAVPIIPADRILIETDAPFLAPAPHRGKRNEPAFVVHTAEAVSDLRGVTLESLCATARSNTIRLFRLDED